ncbi:MAG TPA: protein-disulfide reductase DsbD domain-containing protein [Rhodopila sp.]|uniref:protein-disulfide reductase DsbD family protein n=1 Tax=Rhodopila sp. TaxID=2480087 RepID=UPI002C0CDDFA|nr:protein-disulfide reductase DsbD domain-containing protein [Rhodopila sp.]HVY14894.1 protein-disulfide reductase DsbD domain-containing protein [Rhodopila sp.]
MTRILLFLLALLLPVAAQARESEPVTSARATATLVSDTDAIQAGVPFRVGLRLQLAPGWHTYWKNPGDAGVPPELTFDNAKASAISWPAPRRISEGTVMTYAYTQSVLLPVTATAAPGVLKAHAQWLVCKEICVPEEGDFTLDLPAGTPAPSAQAPLFAAHDRAVPRPSPWPATIARDGTLFVKGAGLAKAGVMDASFIPDAPGAIDDDAAQPLSVRNDGFTLALKLAKGFDPAKGLAGVLSIHDRSGTQTDVTVNAMPGPAPAANGPSLVQVLLFAFLGGLILNLMPCVFPILAMKAVTLANHRHHAHSLAYMMGVLVTFVGLAAALLVARQAGVAAGWGFQFASPIFVALVTWLLFAVGLNLSGVYEVGGRLAGVGSGLADRGGVVGNFFTGLLAVLVATPCTAPFMGAAIAAGLAAPPAVTLLVFAVMGLGLAIPYVALASIPGLVGLLPRPGHWMVVFKQVLAFPMYGAAVWLLWVVSQEAGPMGVLITGAGLVLVGFAAWAFGAARGRGRRLGGAAAAIALLAAVAILPQLSTASAARQVASASNTESFTPARLAALRSEGRPVFVNMTAAWCVTCLVNERVALDSDAVQQAFADHKVAYLKGDWTRQDPAITAFLRDHGRDGVPLYVYFPSDGGTPKVLPQILTQRTVLGLFGQG